MRTENSQTLQKLVWRLSQEVSTFFDQWIVVAIHLLENLSNPPMEALLLEVAHMKYKTVTVLFNVCRIWRPHQFWITEKVYT